LGEKKGKADDAQPECPRPGADKKVTGEVVVKYTSEGKGKAGCGVKVTKGQKALRKGTASEQKETKNGQKGGQNMRSKARAEAVLKGSRMGKRSQGGKKRKKNANHLEEIDFLLNSEFQEFIIPKRKQANEAYLQRIEKGHEQQRYQPGTGQEATGKRSRGGAETA